MENKTLNPENFDLEKMQQTIHDLKVHQIEVDMQNEELRQKQLQLDSLRAKYFDLYNLAPVGYCTLSEKGLILEINLTASKLLGFDRKALVGQPISRFIFKEDQDIYYLQHKLLFETHESNSYELRMVKNDETLFWVNIVETMHQGDDNSKEYRIVLNDITERKQAEKELDTYRKQLEELVQSRTSELRESEARLRMALKAAIAGTWEWDLETNKNIWSDGLYRLYDLDSNTCEASYETWLKSIFSDDRAAVEAQVAEAVKAGTTLNMEWRVNTRDGSLRWLMSQGQPFRNEDGKIIQYQGIVIDISERKQFEEEKNKLELRLLQAQKMESIGNLAGGIAHDFNNILSPVIGFAEILREELPKDSPEQDSIIEILNAAMRARDLVKQILVFSRQNNQESKPVRLQPIVMEAINLLKSSIPSTIQIQTDIDMSCGMVLADPTQIHQIVMNLATNAYHAMQQSGGRLKITLEETELELKPFGFTELTPCNYALMKVMDTGTGIKKEILDKIFEPYFTTKGIGKGTGLGLSVVQGIVKRCNGEIHVHSQPGKGTEFHVYLPILKNDSGINSFYSSEAISGGTENILLVDDEEAIVKLGKRMLEKLGYHVTSCLGSLKALEVFKETPDAFDLIISDMTMPDMTGVVLANKIKEVRNDIPIIICTGFSEQISKEISREFGIQGYIMKPILIGELAREIRNVFNART